MNLAATIKLAQTNGLLGRALDAARSAAFAPKATQQDRDTYAAALAAWFSRKH